MLSTRKAIEAFSVDAGAFAVDLDISQTVGDPNLDPGTELIRLTPPEGVTAPVIRLERSALEFQTGTAVVEGLQEFPQTRDVDFEFVPAAGCPDPAGSDCDRVRVGGRATLVATEVFGLGPGFFASYSVGPVEIEEGQRLTTSLLPGVYRVRFQPHDGSGLALVDQGAIEIGASDRIFRRVIPIPEARSVFGTAHSPMPDVALDGSTAQLLPSPSYRLRCRGADADSAGCTAGVVAVLDNAKGESYWPPRPAGATLSDGSFEITNVDCGECVDLRGALYDFTVRTPAESHLPWFIFPDLEVASSDVQLGKGREQLEVPLPIIHHGTLAAGRSPSAAEVVPGATLRAYVLRGRDRRVVDDPERFEACLGLGPPGTVPPDRSEYDCDLAFLQIAETVADDNGAFMLAVPASIYAPPSSDPEEAAAQ